MSRLERSTPLSDFLGGDWLGEGAASGEHARREEANREAQTWAVPPPRMKQYAELGRGLLRRLLA
jgi:hypothetical protein